jgi:hypothetical protein
MEEAVEWAKRIPNEPERPDMEIDIRPIFEAEDFGPELLRKCENWKNASARKQKSLNCHDPRLNQIVPGVEHDGSRRQHCRSTPPFISQKS